eukprot:7269644-Pyramimonas_sp.AAC.1
MFDDAGAGMVGAGLARDRVETSMENVAPSSGTRTFGHWEDTGGALMTAQTRHRPDILEALRHESRRCSQQPDVRAARLLRSLNSVGEWADCTPAAESFL